MADQPGFVETIPVNGDNVGSSRNARIVAYIDMIFSRVAFILIVVWMCVTTKWYVTWLDGLHWLTSLIFSIAMVTASGLIICYGIELWLACGLRLATRRWPTDRQEAASKERFWIRYNIFLIAATFIIGAFYIRFANFGYGGTVGLGIVLWTTLRVPCVFIVRHFCKELERGIMVPNNAMSHNTSSSTAEPADNNVNASQVLQPQ